MSGGTTTGPASGKVAIVVTDASGLGPGVYTVIGWTGATPSGLGVADFDVSTPPSIRRPYLYIEGSRLLLTENPGTILMLR